MVFRGRREDDGKSDTRAARGAPGGALPDAPEAGFHR